MSFSVASKVILVTGGASGLGYCLAKELLKQGAKGVALVDINQEKGLATQQEFQKEFGKDCCIFIKTDISQYTEFEDAFKRTVSTFKQLDVVINNAAFLSEINWRKCIDVTLIGCMTGTKLAFDTYLPKYRGGSEGLIINVASIVGLDTMGITPAYCAAKHGIVAASRSLGQPQHYKSNQVRVLAICPGHMKTDMIIKSPMEEFNVDYQNRFQITPDDYPMQEPEFVAESILDITKEAENGSVWVIEGGKPAYEVEFKDRFTMRKEKI